MQKTMKNAMQKKHSWLYALRKDSLIIFLVFFCFFTFFLLFLYFSSARKITSYLNNLELLEHHH